MTAYINTKRWKHVLENKLLETYINAVYKHSTWEIKLHKDKHEFRTTIQH